LAGVIVVDASVLIAHLDERDAFHPRAVEVLLDAADNPLGASVLTVAEVLVGPSRERRLEAAQVALGDLALQEIPLGPDAPARLAVLRAETGLRLPDCCVVLAAQEARAEALVTFDEGLRAQAARRGVPVR
jgi:predicted nucleic acid-binding protein